MIMTIAPKGVGFLYSFRFQNVSLQGLNNLSCLKKTDSATDHGILAGRQRHVNCHSKSYRKKKERSHWYSWRVVDIAIRLRTQIMKSFLSSSVHYVFTLLQNSKRLLDWYLPSYFCSLTMELMRLDSTFWRKR